MESQIELLICITVSMSRNKSNFFFFFFFEKNSFAWHNVIQSVLKCHDSTLMAQLSAARIAAAWSADFGMHLAALRGSVLLLRLHRQAAQLTAFVIEQCCAHCHYCPFELSGQRPVFPLPHDLTVLPTTIPIMQGQ